MSSLAKGLALLVAVTCAVWVAVLWRWRSTSLDMTESDIVVFLVLLPLMLFAVVLGVRSAWGRVSARREARASVPAAIGNASGSGAAAENASPNESASHQGQYVLLSAHVASAAGSGATALLEAALRNEPRPRLDPDLRDANGLAVLTARAPDLDVDAVADELRSIVSHKHPTDRSAVREPARGLVRALAALLKPLEAALHEARDELDRVDAREAARAHSTSVQEAPDAQARLRVLVSWPAEWDEFERAVALRWLEASASNLADRFDIETPTGDADALWRHAGQLLRTLTREERDDLVLLVACHSDIDEAQTQSLQDHRRLLSVPGNPRGLIPGEGAAALLLATPRWSVVENEANAGSAVVLLNRPVSGRRDKSVEADGRITAQLLEQIAREALSAARIDATDVASLVCDADQHSARGTELFAAKANVLDHLDSTEDVRRTGAITGHVGVVAPLLVVACAAECASVTAAPCLGLSLGDAHARVAVLARPWRSQEQPAPISGA